MSTTPLGDLVIASRESKGWTRQELHRASGVSYPYISQIETGDRVPSLNTMRRLADALELPVSDLAAMVAPDAWSGSTTLHLSPPATLAPAAISAPSQPSDPSQERAKDAVRRKLRDLSPVRRLHVLAELTAEAAAELQET